MLLILLYDGDCVVCNGNDCVVDNFLFVIVVRVDVATEIIKLSMANIRCIIIDNKYSTMPYCIFIHYMPTGKWNKVHY